MMLKHLLTTFFTVLPKQTKVCPFWAKSKVSNVKFQNWVMHIMKNILLFGDDCLGASSSALTLNSTSDYAISTKSLDNSILTLIIN